MKLKFDEKGYLIPYKRINVTLDDFQNFFVKNFKGESATRRFILNSYLSYVESFSQEISPLFTHWINGSFVTEKKNPNDIDFVTLVDHSIYSKKRIEIDNKFRLKNAKKAFNVDAYTVEIYPDDHSKSRISKIDLVYWDNWFSKTKKNWSKKSFQKGYVEINFE